MHGLTVSSNAVAVPPVPEVPMDASGSLPAVPALQTETPAAELEKQEAEKAEKLKAELAAQEKAGVEKLAAEEAKMAELKKAELEKREAEKAAAAKAMLNRKVSLYVRSIRVANTVSGGSAWDRGSDADIRLTIKVDGTAYRARKTDDKNSVTSDQKAGEVSVRDQIEIDVNDADLYYNDLIGKAPHKITADDLQNGSINLKFGNVESLQLDFKP